MFTTPAHLLTDAEIASEIDRLKRKRLEWELMFTMGDAERVIDAMIYDLEEEQTIRAETPLSSDQIAA